jgi:hypothetical protein
MSTRIQYLVPIDPLLVPSKAAIESAVLALNAAVKARKIEVMLPGKIIFFDCGEGFEAVTCPKCGSDLMPTWQEWMNTSYDENNGFTLSSRSLSCCGTKLRLDQLHYMHFMAFGSFALAIYDTDKTLSDTEWNDITLRVGQELKAALNLVDAHY